MMNIQVRVMSSQGQARIKAMEAELARLRAQTAATTASTARLNRQVTYGMPALSKWGNQVQWAGRQLQYNFTLPILIAAGASAKFALDNERAMTRVAKVYGDTSEVWNRLSQKELPALEQAFVQLSNRFGVNREATLDLAADWAAAGATGIALAKSVKLTMETMILGEIEAADATEALIAIQAQYGQSTKQLSKTVDTLNMIENETGITMEGLIQGFARSAGTARSAGIDVRHLGAMMAALTPAAGSASRAGYSLKTIISRLAAPTKAAGEVMGMMGVNIDDLGWQSMNGAQRLETMAEAFDKLNGHAQGIVSSTIAGRWQISRFDILMRDIINTNGYYQKSLDATSNAQKNYNQRVHELNAVLESNPQKMKQIWVILQNAMADTIQPMLPMIVYLGQQIAKLAMWFSNLHPSIQKLIGVGLLFLALIGPLVRYLGSVANLIGILKAGFHFLGAKVLSVIGLFYKLTFGALLATIGQLRIAAGAAFWMGRALTIGTVVGVTRAIRAISGLALIGPIIAAAGSRMVAVWTATWAAMAVVQAATLGGLLKGLAAAQAVALSGFVAWLGKMRIAQAAMTASLVTSFRTAILKIGTYFTLLPFIVADAMKAVWAVMMIPGGVTAVFMRTWNALAVAMATRWALLTSALMVTWHRWTVVWGGLTAAGAAAVTRVWAGLLVAWRTVVFNMAVLWRVAWMSMARSPVAVFKAVGSALRRFVAVGIALVARFGKFFISWPALIIGAVFGIMYAFRDQLASIWQSIVEGFSSVTAGLADNFAPLVRFFNSAVNAIESAFWRLPAGVRDAFLAVVEIVKQAALAVYDLMSYLNPFARHSPSLVESVTKGMDEIQNQYARAENIGGVFARAARDLAAFKRVADSLGAGEWQEERQNIVQARRMERKPAMAEDRTKVPSSFYTGGASAITKMLPLFDRLVADYNQLNQVLRTQERAVNAQETVVARWQRALDAANAAIDRQQDKLTRLRNRLDTLQSAYDAHEQAMNDYASAPIQGMGRMENQIFRNEMAQKRLRLEILKMNEEAGGGVEDLKDRMASLQAGIELMSGKAAELRSAGAGAGILAPIESEVKKLEAEARSLQKGGGGGAGETPVSKMQQELDELQRKGEMLNLQQALKFDPLTRQVEKLSNGMQEMPFNRIINGIKTERAAMKALTPAINQATRAVDNQELAIKRAQAARDAIQKRYDTESAKLDRLNEKYRQTEEMIRQVESALRSMGQAGGEQLRKQEEFARKQEASAKKAAAAAKKAKAGGGAGAGAAPDLSPQAEQFLGARGDFPEVGGRAKIGREGGLKDQSKLIDEFTKGIAEDVASTFGSFDIFAPIKKWWKIAWNWIKDNVGPVVQAVISGIKSSWSGIQDAWSGSGLQEGTGKTFDTVVDIASSAWESIKAIFKLFAPDVKRIFDAIVEAGKRIWDKLGPELAKFGELLQPLADAFQNIWKEIKPVAAIVGGVLLGAFKIVATVISNVLGPVLNTVIDVLANVFKVIRGVIRGVLAVINGDWKQAWVAAKEIVSGTFGIIWAIIKGIGLTIWGVVKGIVQGIWEFFVWLYDVLVGHSVVPDMIHGIFAAFQVLIRLPGWVWKNILRPIWKWFVRVWKDYIWPALKFWWKGFRLAWKVLAKLGAWLWDNVLKPVWKWVVSLWKKYVGPALDQWWKNVRANWRTLRKLGKWVWNEVLKPVWNWFKSLWDKYVGPALGFWWKGVMFRWNQLKRLGRWVWEQVLKPIWNKVKDLWSRYVQPALQEWWSRITRAWSRLRNMGTWIWNNALKPVYNKFKEMWNSVGGWLRRNKNRVIGPMKSAINAVVGAINAMIRGLNKVADVLPGISWNISLIPKLEKGGEIPGRSVAQGFVTRGARAIVGEGKANHPEYVIPTDPTHRRRAQSLYQQLGNRLGVKDFQPAYESGGILPDAAGGLGDMISKAVGSAKSMTKEGMEWTTGQVKSLASAPFKFFKNQADNLIAKIRWKYGRQATQAGLDEVWRWVTQADDVYSKRARQAIPKKVSYGAPATGSGWIGPVGGPYSVGGSVGSYPGHTGLDLPAATGTPVRAASAGRVITSYDIPGSNPYNSSPYASYGRVITVGHKNGISTLYAHLSDRIARAGQLVGAGSMIGRVGSTGNSTGSHLHYEVRSMGNIVEPKSFMAAQGVRLAQGAIIRRTGDGTLARIGEGDRDEAVVPLPRRWRQDVAGSRDDSGKTEIHINGNLEFPNIRSGEDAEDFIKNLEILARD